MQCELSVERNKNTCQSSTLNSKSKFLKKPGTFIFFSIVRLSSLITETGFLCVQCALSAEGNKHMCQTVHWIQNQCFKKSVTFTLFSITHHYHVKILTILYCQVQRSEKKVPNSTYNLHWIQNRSFEIANVRELESVNWSCLFFHCTGLLVMYAGKKVNVPS